MKTTMPHMDLTEDGIPVYELNDPTSKGVTVLGMDGAVYVFCYDTHETCGTLAYDWRIDLDNGQGFGYVARHLVATTKGRVQLLKASGCRVDGLAGLEKRLLRGIAIESADHAVVAKACTELHATKAPQD